VQLTIVIPTYNEAENLPRLFSALFALPVEGLKILVVDDNSPDGSGLLAERLAEEYRERATVLHRPGKLGLGSAYILGFRAALADGAQAICQMDADFSHPPEKIPLLLAALQSYDIAIGSRYVPGGSVDVNWPLWRRGLSAFGSLYARAILGLPLRDATGGFKVWRAQALAAMPWESIRSNGYAFQVEMAYIAHRLGFTFQELPIYFADRRWGVSKMSFRIQREAAAGVWRMRYQYRRLRPES